MSKRPYVDNKYHERFEKIREWRRMRDLARQQGNPGDVQCPVCGSMHRPDQSCLCVDNGCQ